MQWEYIKEHGSWNLAAKFVTPSATCVFHSKFNVSCELLFLLCQPLAIINVFSNIAVVYAYHVIATLIARTKQCLPMILKVEVNILVEAFDVIYTMMKMIGTLMQTTMIFRILAMKFGEDQMR